MWNQLQCRPSLTKAVANVTFHPTKFQMCDHRMRRLDINLAHQFISLYFFQNLSCVANSIFTCWLLVRNISPVNRQTQSAADVPEKQSHHLSTASLAPLHAEHISIAVWCSIWHLTQRPWVRIPAACCWATTLGKLFTPTHLALAGCSGLVLAYLAEVWETADSRFIATATAIYTVFGMGCWTFMQCLGQLSLLPSVGW